MSDDTIGLIVTFVFLGFVLACHAAYQAFSDWIDYLKEKDEREQAND